MSTGKMTPLDNSQGGQADLDEHGVQAQTL
jgi:hypothetical protein